MDQVYEHSLAKKKSSITAKNRLLTIGMVTLFSVICIIVLLPLAALFLTSFRPGQELIRYGLSINLDVEGFTLNNYTYLFSGGSSYFLWFKNSMVLTILTVVLTLLICYFIAYGLSMYDFKFRNVLFFLVIATMMVPFEIMMLPLYQEMIDMNLINTTTGVIVPGLCSAAAIFFFRQYMLGLPKELLAAGRIDGATEYGICIKIMFPITKPAFAAMGILCAMNSWNNMLWPLLVFRDADKFTLPIGLNTLLTPYGNNYDLLIAGSCFSVIPIFILFLCFQKYFIEGLTTGAVKG